jgi:ubiquitin carboxyl-terminal hydrolase 1
MKDRPEDASIRMATIERLAAVTEALEDDDYEEKTLLNKCKIAPKSRVSSTKTRQAVIARPPKSLVVHFNRSVFDELTGDLKKNYAEVRFPKVLDLGPWCLGSSGTTQDSSTEEWILKPDSPMIASTTGLSRLRGPFYELRAVVTHYGRHENGHYICYKKHPSVADDEKEPAKEQWWRLSDDDVMMVSEENVLGQGGVFMLFFDLVEPAKSISAGEALESRPTEQTFTASSSEPMASKPLDLQPIHNTIEQTSPEDLALAANVPLPEFDDVDLSESDWSPQSTTTREESISTSISECDEESAHEYEQQNYSPTKAILVPPYLQSSNVHKEGEEAGKQGIVPSGNLVMV